MIEASKGFTGRHGGNRPQEPLGFKCPSCGSDQSGPLSGGCQACGSGGGAKHVGIDPIARPDLARQFAPDSPPLSRPVDMQEAWLAWVRPFRGRWDAEQEKIAHLAFHAGYQYASGQVVAATIEPPLAGTAESRTLIAALRLYIENLAPISKEEIASGELLSVADAEALIAKLERASA